MLIGEYTHTLDPKKRISLPAKFRKDLGKTVVITYGLDNCVALYPLSTWKNMTEKLSDLSMGQSGSRDFSRFMLSRAQEVDIDSAGRILIPDGHKEYAGLKTKVVLAGVHNRVELWNEKAWIDYTKRIQKQADALAEKLGELGMI